MQVTQGTQWGRGIWKSFEDREGSSDNYGKHSFLEYLDFVADPYTYGTEYDIVGKRVVTANLKLIDDNIRVNVEPILVLDDITEKENGIKPSDVIKTRLKILIIKGFKI